jgi:hypothetical protein
MRFSNPANCAGTDVNDWFSDGNKVYENRKILERICQPCEARVECLQYALENAVLGFWAGTSEKQRRILRKQLNIIPTTLLESYSA